MLLSVVGTAAFLGWLSVFLAALWRGSQITECPSCHSPRIRPSWPKLIDKILSYSWIMPYRCEKCLKRFYAQKARRF
jgi:hypothetical protein